MNYLSVMAVDEDRGGGGETLAAEEFVAEE